MGGYVSLILAVAVGTAIIGAVEPDDFSAAVDRAVFAGLVLFLHWAFYGGKA
jgi:hypothetical protein